ncbi:hypothetical protein [Streptomyces sp. NPDC050504]|uniref:hypothetical protein n=1 Tax=Streptomyces sp. NPDC050504 TaxID=3365618 RepID=UPI003790A8BB
MPDGTSDDQGVLPDETSDDQGESPDATSDDQGGPCAAAPTAGPERWFPMRGAFLDFLASNATGDDDAIASHVTEVRVRKAGGRGFAEVRVTYGADEAVEARRVARAFAQWRHTGYGDAGRVRVLGPGWAGVERDW